MKNYETIWKYLNEEMEIYTIEEAIEYHNKSKSELYPFNKFLLFCGCNPEDFWSNHNNHNVSENLYEVVIRDNKRYLVDSELEDI